MTDSSHFRIGTSCFVRSRSGERGGLVVRDGEQSWRAFDSDGVLIGLFPSYRAATRAATGEANNKLCLPMLSATLVHRHRRQNRK
jgi:hypothetical protein